MKCYDFEYDGELLSQYGMIICKFGGGGTDTISNGSEIEFNTVSSLYGQRHNLVNTQYNDCISATFQICGNPCHFDGAGISIDEARGIMRWLNRRDFHKFRLIGEEYGDIYYNASFNVSRIEFHGVLYGFELEMFTDSPFAHSGQLAVSISGNTENWNNVIPLESDDEGFVYPDMEIVVKSDGDLTIVNEFENRTTFIKNCVAGEIIKMSYPVIETSVPSHKIMDDFNWVFFRLANTFRNNNNHITASLPCTIKIRYSPIVKIGI